MPKKKGGRRRPGGGQVTLSRHGPRPALAAEEHLDWCDPDSGRLVMRMYGDRAEFCDPAQRDMLLALPGARPGPGCVQFSLDHVQEVLAVARAVKAPDLIWMAGYTNSPYLAEVAGGLARLGFALIPATTRAGGTPQRYLRVLWHGRGAGIGYLKPSMLDITATRLRHAAATLPGARVTSQAIHFDHTAGAGPALAAAGHIAGLLTVPAREGS